MSPLAASRRRQVSGRAVSSDAGTTLAELTVAMALTTVIMAVFTTVIVQMYQISNTIMSRETAQAQVHLAYVRVDRQLRYAYGLTEPGQVGTDWYAEYVTTNTGPAICGQLRLNAAAEQLQSRSWPRGQTPPTTWTVLASDVSGTTPFTFYEADSTYGGVQQLQVLLTANVGAGESAATRQIGDKFTARNTSVRTKTLKPADACIVRS
jgi:hypothetical protein